ncbi:MAG: hypothetical protein K2X35_25560 [Bryobacteraceae bacterium]|nr:hypothetical protein [Bryobacteraceae bacterium]
METRSALTRLVEQARRRYVLQITLDQFAWAAIFAAATVLLLLLVGTQILNWWWPLIIFGGAFAFGLRRTLKRAPDPYRVAQQLDRRLELHDSLSTAYAFRNQNLGDREALRLEQQEDAIRTAAGVNLRIAVPLAFPRHAYAAIGVLLVAVGFFAVRYGVTGSMDLRRNLVEVAFDHFFTPETKVEARNRADDRRQREQTNFEESEGVDGQEVDPKGEAPLDSRQSSEENASESTDNAKEKAEGPGQKREGQGEGEQEGKNSKESEGQPGNDSKQGDAAGKQGKPENQQGNHAKQGNSPQESGNLLDKMKDAMNNLLNKMKMQQKPGDGQQQQQASQKQGQQGQPQKGDKGQQSQNNQSGSSENAEAKDEQGDKGDASQTAQSNSKEKGSDRSSSPDSKGGVGQQDGQKDTQLAEQMEAMGKISEILGKRAQNLTGEVMVEVSSTKQHLKTAYSNKTARHVEAGGEIHRDEVPMQFQQYVQQYFNEIRKAQKPPAK